jgi:hypothetical protein
MTMFAIRHKKTGKFLKAFNGSFNKASFYTEYALATELVKEAERDDPLAVLNKMAGSKKRVTWEQVVDRMWCLKTPNGAQLYKSEGAVKASIGDGDWYEIVPVVTQVKRGYGK